MPIFYIDTGSFNSVQITGSLNSTQVIGYVNGAPTSTFVYKNTFAGGNLGLQAAFGDFSAGISGLNTFGFTTSDGLVFNTTNTTPTPISRASIRLAGQVNTAGSETGDLVFTTQAGGATMSDRMRIYSNGNIAIGSTISDNSYRLNINLGAYANAALYVLGSTYNVGNLNTATQIVIGATSYLESTYRLTNAGGAVSPKFIAHVNGGLATANNNSLSYDVTNQLTFAIGNGTYAITRAAIQASSTSNTAGAEVGDLVFLTKPSNTAVAERMRILGDSRIQYTASFTATTTSQSYFQITGSIQQVQTASAQIYGVNIAPTMIYTTGSQTQTALRVTPTFSGSTAFTSSQQNIIADFGATSVGTQFSVNDTTSGSIYMVNDVSGLPILEATSDWTVNMYNYPTRVFQKTGSAIIISGSLTVTSGSITMPSRPAFRVYGASVTGISAPTTISGSATTVDYNQGNNYNNTTGIFTAPIAGLYSVYYNGRTNSGATQQVIVYKNSITSSLMWETTGSNSGHFGVSSILSLAVNDTLRATVAVGTIQFDNNDNWGAAYIG